MTSSCLHRSCRRSHSRRRTSTSSKCICGCCICTRWVRNVLMTCPGSLSRPIHPSSRDNRCRSSISECTRRSCTLHALRDKLKYQGHAEPQQWLFERIFFVIFDPLRNFFSSKVYQEIPFKVKQ